MNHASGADEAAAIPLASGVALSPEAARPETPPPEASRHGFVVSHTHWDRAWYLPFERFRLRMVRLVDRVLEVLESDPEYRAFTLDGQAVLLDDYLAIRPEREDRLRLAITSGRLVVGPWYTLPDLFLVSGESVIRNLQMGLATCERFGGALREGYLPDPFGHTAQMPQVLRGFGIDSYVFMRGLDAETKRTHGAIFDWAAPDGSTVLAVYQRDGYFPAASLGHPSVYGRFDGHTPTAALARQRLTEGADAQAALQDARTLLLSNGFDHMPEQPELPRLLREAAPENLALTHGTLGDFLDALRAETADGSTGGSVSNSASGENPTSSDPASGARTPRQMHSGDLLGNADHPVLRSVNSTRLYLKQHNHAAQSALVRWAEPLSAMLEATGLGQPARPFLQHAWRELLKNHPHDDICGCSVDPVHEDDEARFRAVLHVAEELVQEHTETLVLDGFAPPARTGKALASGAASDEVHDLRPNGPLPTGTDVIVYNRVPRAQTVEVEAEILFPNPEGEFGPPVNPLPLAAVDARGRDVPLTVLSTEAPVLRSRYLEGTWGRRYRLRLRAELPPLGYALIHVFQDAGAKPVPLPPPATARLRAASGAVPAPSTASDSSARGQNQPARAPSLVTNLATLAPLVAFEYQMDAGDTYSFGPVPVAGLWRAECVHAEPHRDGSFALRHRLEVPAGYDRSGGRPEPETVTLDIRTTVRLHPDGTAALSIAYANTARDGRLRLVVPTATDASSVMADAMFRLARREHLAHPRTPEAAPDRWKGYPGELDYLTHHQGDFSLAEGERYVTFVAARGLPEVEILRRKNAQEQNETFLAVTLHRAVGWLSVAGGRVRRCQAGPQVPTPGAQCLRPIRAEIGVGVAADRWEAVRRAEAFAHPPVVREVPALPFASGAAEYRGTRMRSARGLELSGEAVRLSAFAPHPTEHGIAVARVVNLSDQPVTATLTPGWLLAEARRTDLEEQWEHGEALPIESGAVRVTLAPHQIGTVLLRARGT